ncbi:omega-conotoxin-like protein 1 [Ctenocephalides felis]|uniref:omega-conotoxin-like protein 1 n=1 Tax=Ctenocephalides felis TaxID=7515 RepID=UPI000E6E3AF6|nr:omega-conotoxin-like protein 1 [Ctenocephalides felis]XP_026477428.1 omega-conotoxin-like protein 1 [Ctenocephalides felis]
MSVITQNVQISKKSDTGDFYKASSPTCGRHGDPCVSPKDCCPGIRCHQYANRCQVIITEEELLAQRP